MCKNNIKLHDHSVDVSNPDISNQFIIIRNPIERFISAVYYALQVYCNTDHIKTLLFYKIDTPEKWIQIWRNPSHQYYNILMNEMKNKTQIIGTTYHEYKWTYLPQSTWINNPKYICIMDNYEKEVSYLFKNILNRDIYLPNNNSTIHHNNKLSDSSIEFLQTFYNKDFFYYNKYKNISIEERIPIV